NALRAELRDRLGDFEGRLRAQENDLVSLYAQFKASEMRSRREFGEQVSPETLAELGARVTALQRVIQRGFEDRPRLEAEYSLLVSELACQQPVLPLAAVIHPWACDWVQRWREAGDLDDEILELARGAFSDAYRSAPQLQSFHLGSPGGGCARVTIP